MTDDEWDDYDDDFSDGFISGSLRELNRDEDDDALADAFLSQFDDPLASAAPRLAGRSAEGAAAHAAPLRSVSAMAIDDAERLALGTPMSLSAPPFEGVAVALCTIFDARREVDAVATAELAEQLVDAGVTAVVVTGTTGEAATLTRKERRKIVKKVKAAVGGAVPVFAGTGASSVHQAAMFTADAVDNGADGVLVLSPPHLDDPRAYFDAVAKDTAGVPMLAYHFPEVSAPGISVDVLGDLPIVGVKDSSGDAKRMLATLTEFDGAFYTGSEALLAYAGALGAAGVISGLANVEPELCARAFDGDFEAQRELSGLIAMCSRGYPGTLKDLVAARFDVSPVTRL